MRPKQIALPKLIRLIASREAGADRRLDAIQQLRLDSFALGDEWRKQAVPLFSRLAEDPREKMAVRLASLFALSDGLVVPENSPLLGVLRNFLTSRSTKLRQHATRALAKVAGQEARDLLHSLLRDESVAKQAREALIARLEPPLYDLPDFRKRPKPLRGSHSSFLERAIELAIENVTSGRGGPFGAVIVQAGAVVAEGTNLVTAVNDPSAHAEVMAIRAACARNNRLHLTDCVIYSSCEPCPMCLGAIHWARVAKLHYAATRADAAEAGFDDSFIYDQLPLAPATRSIPARRLLAREGRAPLDAWLKDEGRIAY